MRKRKQKFVEFRIRIPLGEGLPNAVVSLVRPCVVRPDGSAHLDFKLPSYIRMPHSEWELMAREDRDNKCLWIEGIQPDQIDERQMALWREEAVDQMAEGGTA